MLAVGVIGWVLVAALSLWLWATFDHYGAPTDTLEGAAELAKRDRIIDSLRKTVEFANRESADAKKQAERMLHAMNAATLRAARAEAQLKDLTARHDELLAQQLTADQKTRGLF